MTSSGETVDVIVCACKSASPIPDDDAILRTPRMAKPAVVRIAPTSAAVDALAAKVKILVTTPAPEPLPPGVHRHPRRHTTFVGSDARHKVVSAPDVIALADFFVCDHTTQSLVQAESCTAFAGDTVSADGNLAELDEVIAGKVSGRGAKAEVTVCDLTGTGVWDIAIATPADGRTTASGIGERVRSQPKLDRVQCPM